MDFDFSELYKNYSNTELLKILEAPHHYQPQAVTAVQQILATRDITADDRITVNPEKYQAPADALNNGAAEEEEEASIFDGADLPEPSRQFQTRKWAIIILVALPYLIQVYSVLYWIYLTTQYGYLGGSGLVVGFQVAVVTLIFIALYQFAKVQRLGYLLVGALVLYMTAAYGISLMGEIKADFGSLTLMYFLLTAACAGIIYKMGDPAFYEYYIEYESFRKFRMIGLLLAIAFFLIASFFKFVVQSGASI